MTIAPHHPGAILAKRNQVGTKNPYDAQTFEAFLSSQTLADLLPKWSENVPNAANMKVGKDLRLKYETEDENGDPVYSFVFVGSNGVITPAILQNGTRYRTVMTLGQLKKRYDDWKLHGG